MKEKTVKAGATPQGIEKIVPDELTQRIGELIKGLPVASAKQNERSFAQWIHGIENSSVVHNLLSVSVNRMHGKLDIVLRPQGCTGLSEVNRRIRITPNGDGTNRVELSKQVFKSDVATDNWPWVSTTPQELLRRYPLSEVKAGFISELTNTVVALERAVKSPGRGGR